MCYIAFIIYNVLYFYIDFVDSKLVIKNMIKYAEILMIIFLTFQIWINKEEKEFFKFLFFFTLFSLISNILANREKNISTILHYTQFLIVFVAYINLKKSNKNNWLVYLIGLIVSIFANSRTSILLILALVSYEYITQIINEKNNKVEIIKKALICILIVVVTFFGLSYFLEELSKETASNIERTMLIETSIDILKNHFYIGIGPINFANYAINNYGIPITRDLSVHNYFLELLVECGFFGFLLIIISYIKIGANIFNVRKDKLPTNRLLIYLLVFLFFNVLSGPIRVLTGLILGINLIDKRNEDKC